MNKEEEMCPIVSQFEENLVKFISIVNKEIEEEINHFPLNRFRLENLLKLSSVISSLILSKQ